MLSLLGLTLAVQLAALPADAQDRVHHALEGRTTVRMPPATGADVVIDGNLTEEVWKSAMILTGFSQYAPADGRPAPDSTEVLVWYSPTAIYFGIRAFEPHGEVSATMAERDRIDADDRIELHLDTFLEKRKAFVFIVNPFGVQADGMKTEGGGFIPGANIMPGMNDLSADFQWQSRGRLTDFGYEVEVRIPFNSLRFPAAHVQRWGIQIVRHVQHSGYEHTWTPVRRASASFIAQEGILDGLTGLHHGVNVALNPELTNTITGAPPIEAGPTGWSYSSEPRAGGNVRAALGSNFVLNGTIRPDFSQVEADATQVAADQRFALFYPERRPFFVEGSDQFNVPNTLVYTRQIVQPDAALKLTGRLGRTNVAILSALDAPAGLLSDDGKRVKAIVDILRLSRDFSLQSTAGLLYSERVSSMRHNRTVGADLRHVFGLHFVEFQVAGSRTGASGIDRGGLLWSGAIDRTGRGFGFNYNLLGISPEFASDNGFVARTGFVRGGISNRITLFGGQGKFFEQYNVFFSGNGLWQYNDFFDGKSMLESRLSANNSFTFRGGWQLSVTPEIGSYAFEPAAFDRFATGGTGGGGGEDFAPPSRISTFTMGFGGDTPRYRRFNASARITTGFDVDFLEASKVRREAWNANLDLRPTDRLRIGATYASNEMRRRVDGLSSFSTAVPRVRIEYQVSRPIFVRVVSQYEASRREPFVDWQTGRVLLVRDSDGNWRPSVQNISNIFQTDWLFSYRPRPGTVFFAGYGSSMTEHDALSFRGLDRVSDSFFLKASYFWESRAGQ